MTEQLPIVGRQYYDARGRTLTVVFVKVGDPVGREVIGKLHEPLRHGPRDVEGVNYATDLPTWAAIWRDKQPPRPLATLRTG